MNRGTLHPGRLIEGERHMFRLTLMETHSKRPLEESTVPAVSQANPRQGTVCKFSPSKIVLFQRSIILISFLGYHRYHGPSKKKPFLKVKSSKLNSAVILFKNSYSGRQLTSVNFIL